MMTLSTLKKLSFGVTSFLKLREPCISYYIGMMVVLDIDMLNLPIST